jgi:ferritin-like metal-binding protein YciE
MRSMEELFHAQVQDIYFAEKQLLKALPKLAKNSTNERLAQAFTHHLKETVLDASQRLAEWLIRNPGSAKRSLPRLHLGVQ